MKARGGTALGVFSALTAAAALIGARVMQRRPRKVWYRLLAKPPQTPPDIAFAVVWPVLYASIAYSGCRVWRSREKRGAKMALALWGTQLAANAAWTPLFFGAHRARAALADLGVNLALLAAYVVRASKVDRVASLVMVPYLGWLVFAGTINWGIIRRNPRLLAG